VAALSEACRYFAVPPISRMVSVYAPVPRCSNDVATMRYSLRSAIPRLAQAYISFESMAVAFW
jgi:hypothetical protein